MNDTFVVRPRAGAVAPLLVVGAIVAGLGVVLRARGVAAPWGIWGIVAGCAFLALLLGMRGIEVGPRELRLRALFGPGRAVRWADIQRVELVRGSTLDGVTGYTLVLHVAGAGGASVLREQVAHLPREGLRRVLQAVASRAHRVELDHAAEALRAGDAGTR